MLSNKQKQDKYRYRDKPLPPLPLPNTSIPQPIANGHQTEPVIPENAENWDGWPDGDWSSKYSYKFFNATGGLMSHWASSSQGGPKKGSDKAKQWHNGHVTGRVCVGVITCDNPQCNIVIRPQTRNAGRQLQLQQNCSCGIGSLTQIECGVISQIWKYEKGIKYINGGTHNHPRPTYTLHLTQNQWATFERIVLANPKVKALPLLVGVPTVNGPGESVAEISPVFLNKDRIKANRRKIIQHAQVDIGADNFIRQFSEFQGAHPGFVVHSTIGLVTVIVMQTRFMASNLVNDQLNNQAVNGIVSDAAHGYWIDSKSLLIISSVYGFTLHCWIPALISYSNGASEDHYRLHFLALFLSIHEECERRGIETLDSYFSMVIPAQIFFFTNSY